MKIKFNGKGKDGTLQLIALIKIKSKSNKFFTKNNLYPVLYFKTLKTVGVMDDDYNINSCYYYSEFLQSIWLTLDNVKLEYEIIEPNEWKIDVKSKTIKFKI